MGALTRREFNSFLAASACLASGAGPAGGPAPESRPGPRASGRTVVILGGGFAGITAARELRRALGPEHAVILIDRSPTFMMGLRKLWVMTRPGARQEGERPRVALRSHGIDVRQATVTAIEMRDRIVRTDRGDVRFDYLLVALGAEPRPDLVPGFSDAAFNLYDVDGAERLRARLSGFQGGTVAVTVLGTPYKCPPAPFEAAMLLDEYFRRREMRDKVELHAITPLPMSLPVLGPAACHEFERRLAAKGIAFAANRRTLRLEGRRLVSEAGALECDILVGVPPHRVPRAVKDSGLTGTGEWIPVARATMRTDVEGVWAAGDCTEILMNNQSPLPKAGVFAEAQGRVAAAGIAREILGSSAPAFEGHGYCFIEHGSGLAGDLSGEFLAPGGPKVALAPPTEETFRKKLEFERSRLASWF